MSSETPWEKHKRLKFRNHDFTLDQMTDLEADIIRSEAIKNFKETKESCNVRLISAAFMEYLKEKGFRITKIGEPR